MKHNISEPTAEPDATLFYVLIFIVCLQSYLHYGFTCAFLYYYFVSLILVVTILNQELLRSCCFRYVHTCYASHSSKSVTKQLRLSAIQTNYFSWCSLRLYPVDFFFMAFIYLVPPPLLKEKNFGSSQASSESCVTLLGLKQPVKSCCCPGLAVMKLMVRGKSGGIVCL